VTAENQRLRGALMAAIDGVFDHGQFMLGPEVGAFETAAARRLGVAHAVGLNSGTDALVLALKAVGVSPGDRVITVANSFVATAGAIRQLGAVPHFVDVGDDENMCPDSLAREIETGPRAIVPVHLRGRPADLSRILPIAAACDVPVVEDASQAFGAWSETAATGRRPVGGHGRVGCFSLHPQKILGALGDAGIAVTDDPDLAEHMALQHHHGLRTRDDAVTWGQNSRLDSIQAAALLVKLGRVDGWIERRRSIAHAYRAAFADLDLTLPSERPGERAVYYHYSIMSDRRDALRQFLADQGIDARIHYPVPIHRQPAARQGTIVLPKGGLPVTDRQAGRQLTLPIHHDFTDGQVDRVITAVRAFHLGGDV
jgi:dTDP-4-amino-4,6-dideoxygalactose transaminase